MKRHRWGEKIAVTANKTERECLHGCGIVKVSRHEFEGGRNIYWTEFWRGLDRIEGEGTPECTEVAPHVAYSAGTYPL